MSKIAYGNHSITLIDTPGDNSKKKSLHHVVHLVEALTAFELNAIFVVVEYDENGDKMLENYDETAQPLYNKNYSDKIIIILTKFDRCDHYNLNESK